MRFFRNIDNADLASERILTRLRTIHAQPLSQTTVNFIVGLIDRDYERFRKIMESMTEEERAPVRAAIQACLERKM